MIRDSRWRWAFWPVPLIFLAVGLALPMFTHGLDRAVDIAPGEADPALEFIPGSLGASRAVASTVATAMLSFIGVVFTMSVVAVQLTATQLSPRILRIFILQRLTKWTLGVFLATFAFALSVLGFLDDPGGGQHTFLPIFSILTVWLWVSTSVVFFLAYVSRLIRLMQPVALIGLTAAEAWWAFARVRRVDERITADEIEWGERRFVIRAHSTGVVTDVRVSRLVRVALSEGCLLRIRVRVGDYLTRNSPLVEAYGPGRGRSGDGVVSPVVAFLVRRSFRFGAQRAVVHDPVYGLRLLVDIVVRALSSAINDPTTAVQALDRIIEVLRVAGSLPEPTGVYTDRRGRPRVVVDLPDWRRLVQLACTEIRTYGADSPQVTRRMLAGLDDLAGTLPAQRRAPLREQRDLLVAAVDARVTDPYEREVALLPDRQGFG